MSQSRAATRTDHGPLSRAPRLLSLAACCALLPLTAGCLRRTLTIRTEPPAAHVFVDDASIGKSPATYDFEWYGWHRVTIRKDGFERLEDRRLLQAPPHLWIPFDVVMELVPFAVRDDRTWSYTLTPQAVLPTPQPPGVTHASPSDLQPLVSSPSGGGEPAAGQPPAAASPSPEPFPSEDRVMPPASTEPSDAAR